MIDARIIKRLQGPGQKPFELNIQLRSDASVTVLLGPSGAGKTLTLNCLAGFARPEEGRILVQDQIFFDAEAGVHLSPRQRHCGYIFQDHALFPHMTLRQNLRFATDSRHPKPSLRERHVRITDLLEAFELSDLAKRFPRELSGGQKQRASIARALASEPRLLLLDEPTRGLDIRLRANFYDLLRQTQKRSQAPIVLVTHDLDECFELADTVCVMDSGRFLQAGPKQQVIGKPATVELARSLALYNLAPAEILLLDPGRNLSRLRVAEHELEGPYLPGRLRGDQGWICIRRQEIKVFPAGARPGNNRLTLPTVETAHTARGVRIVLEDDWQVEVSESDFAELRGSKSLQLEIPPAAVHFLVK